MVSYILKLCFPKNSEVLRKRSEQKCNRNLDPSTSENIELFLNLALL